MWFGLQPRHLKGQACVAQKQNFCAYGKRLRVNSHEMRIKGGPVEENEVKNKYIEVYERPKIQHFIWRDIKVFL